MKQQNLKGKLNNEHKKMRFLKGIKSEKLNTK